MIAGADTRSRPPAAGPGRGRPLFAWGSCRTEIKVALAVLMTGVFLLCAANLADMGKAVATIGHVALAAWAALAAVVALNIGLRWFRLMLLLGWRKPGCVLRATVLHIAAVALLPAKLGELVLPFAINRDLHMPWAEAVGLLIVVRLYDLLALLFLGGIALTTVGPALGLGALVGPGVAIGLGAGLSLALLPVLSRLMLRVLLPWLRPGLAGWVARLAQPATGLSVGQGLGLALLTLLTWSAIVAAVAIASAAVGLQGVFGSSLAVATSSSFAFALPIAGMANVGPYEAAFAGTLAALGRPLGPALAAAILVHACAALTPIAAAAVLQAGQALRAIGRRWTAQRGGPAGLTVGT